MVARAELYAILSEFADQEIETPLSPLAVAVYRRLAAELPEEFTEVLQFELTSRSQLVVDQDELTSRQSGRPITLVSLLCSGSW
jgi:hypothetical protein